MKHDSSNSPTAAQPSREQIAIRAELLWKAQGFPSGRDEQIWWEAERQLLDEAREVIAPSRATSKPAEPKESVPAPAAAAEQMTFTLNSSGSSKRK